MDREELIKKLLRDAPASQLLLDVSVALDEKAKEYKETGAYWEPHDEARVTEDAGKQLLLIEHRK